MLLKLSVRSAGSAKYQIATNRSVVWMIICCGSKGKGKGIGRYSSSWEPHLRVTGRHLPYGITQCYLPPDTSERAPPNPSHAGWYSIYLPRRDGRLSWPSKLDSVPAGSRTRNLSITSPMPNRCTTKIYVTVPGSRYDGVCSAAEVACYIGQRMSYHGYVGSLGTHHHFKLFSVIPVLSPVYMNGNYCL